MKLLDHTARTGHTHRETDVTERITAAFADGNKGLINRTSL